VCVVGGLSIETSIQGGEKRGSLAASTGDDRMFEAAAVCKNRSNALVLCYGDSCGRGGCKVLARGSAGQGSGRERVASSKQQADLTMLE